MPKGKQRSRGDRLEQRLRRAIRQVERVPLPGTVEAPLLRGVTNGGNYSLPRQNVLAEARTLLLRIGRIYRYENSIVLAQAGSEGYRLQEIKIGDRVVPETENVLGNYFVCEQSGFREESPPTQFSPPKPLVLDLLHDIPTCALIPVMRHFAKRPVFDEHFRLCIPGWNEESGIFVDASEVEIGADPKPVDSANPMPPYLSELLRDFPFRSPTDRMHALAFLLTGFLANHFTYRPKPVGLLDGNQPGVGKTLLIQAIGAVLDGSSPCPINFTADPEALEKKIGAVINSSRHSVLLFDNCKPRGKGGIDSSVLESFSMAPKVTTRLLGHSSLLERPNSYLWAITMNDTSASKDLVQRALPIRLVHEGDPRKRDFGGRDPLKFAQEHRQEIFQELAQMVYRWHQGGMQRSQDAHRCQDWAQLIGGILAANGFSGFLQNLDEAAGEFSSDADELQALLEKAQNNPMLVHFLGTPANEISNDKGNTASGWIPIIDQIESLKLKLLTAASDQGKGTKIGNYLSAHVDSDIPYRHGEKEGTARLRKQKCRANQTRYYFEVSLAEPGTPKSEEPPVLDRPESDLRRLGSAIERSNGLDLTHALSPLANGNGATYAKGNDENWQ